MKIVWIPTITHSRETVSLILCVSGKSEGSNWQPRWQLVYPSDFKLSLGDTEMLSSARSKICPTCQSTDRVRIRRRFWMRLSPFSKHYRCNTCGRQFIYVSLLSVLTTFFMGILLSLLAILADPLGIGGQQGFGVKQTVLLGIGIGLSALGSFFAFVKYCLERLT